MSREGCLLEYEVQSLHGLSLFDEDRVKDEGLPPQAHLQQLLQFVGHVTEEGVALNKVANLRKLLLVVRL